MGCLGKKKEEEVDVEKKPEEEKPDPPKLVSFRRLFFLADGLDKLMIFIGTIASLGHGVTMPLFIVFFGDVLDGFQPGVVGDNAEPCIDTTVFTDPDTNITTTLTCAEFEDLLAAAVSDNVTGAALKILYLAAAAFVLSYFQVAFFTISAQRQALRIRHAYFRALVRQEMGFYDQEGSGGLSTRITSDIPKIQEAIGDKLGSCLQYFGMFAAGMGVGFGYSWKLTLVIFSVVPLMIIGGAIMAKMIGEAAAGGQGFYAKAGAVADETLRMIRTVIAFGTHDLEQARYEAEIAKAREEGKKKGRVAGIGLGFTMGVIFASYALTFFYGNKLVEDGDLSQGSVLIVLFAVVFGAMSIGQAAPSFSSFAAGRGAAFTVLDIIAREPEIDSLSEEGERPEMLDGELTFENVGFSYPTRPDETVLKGLSFVVKPNETVALVGESGCGKSTCVGLLERFYDVSSGAVKLDGTNLKDLNISWLRNQIALVSQQPVLFPRSIFYNIALGKDNATMEEVVEAAKMANAHDFISAFPDGYDTEVGDQGAQLSGGQKQRIAIARALIKKPSILLLDEATSALDNESERDVQAALDGVAAGHTTVVIAHRLSTVFSADKIVVIREGAVQEMGPPQELVNSHGAFYHMVHAQYGSGEPNEEFDLSKLANIEPATADEKKKSGKKKKKAAKVAKVAEAEATALEEEEDIDKAELDQVKVSMIKWAWGLNKSETLYLFIGSFCAVIEGLVWPVYTLLLADVIAVLLDPDHTAGDIAVWCYAFLALAAIVFVVIAVKMAYLERASEELTFKLRKAAYHVMIKQEAAWYDLPEHSKGILTTRLAEDANKVRGILGDRLGVAITTISTILGGLGVAFYFCWSVALVVLGCFPIVAFGGMLQFKMVTGFASDKHFESSGKFAGDVVENVATVASLGRLRSFVTEYTNMLIVPSRKMHRTAHVQGIAFGFTEFAMLAIWSLGFWFGGLQVSRNVCEFQAMFKSIMAIIIMAMIAGQTQALAPDAAKASKGAKRLYLLLEKQRKREEELSNEGKKATPPVTGAIQFEDVEFTYPARPDAKVLRGLTLSVKPGQTVALVGKSGCGKSTAVALLEQLYQPTAGVIKLDGRPLAELDVDYVRKHIAYVTQQPELFSMSIGDNIKYGLDNVSQEQMEEAARQANAHDFISEFVDGYDTLVGSKGMQLSGGQRQRIAIARALVRQADMKILLLDEASSALDTKSEQLVHESLERFRQGRTTVMIAHRLSTIRNADKICVIDEGVVVEQGSHDELMAKHGTYFDLLSSQGQLGDGSGGNTGGATPQTDFATSSGPSSSTTAARDPAPEEPKRRASMITSV